MGHAQRSVQAGSQMNFSPVLQYGDMTSLPKRESVVRVVLSLAVVSGIIAYGLRQERDAEAAVLLPSPTTSATSVAAAPTQVSDPLVTDTTSSTVAPAVQPSATSTSQSGYRDGTYSATGQYEAPDGLDQIGVSITIRNGVITDSTVTPMARRRDTAEFQQAFAASYATYVTSKPIDSVRLRVVAGASLTTEGFMRALDTIKQQAAS